MTDLQAELQAEQRTLERKLNAAIKDILKKEDRDFFSGADEHTSLILADLAGEQAAEMSRHLDPLYFGRMDVRIGGHQRTVYIGKHAFGKAEVISWRSDVGGLFYLDALDWTTDKGLKGEIQRKRQIDIEQRQVKRLTELYDRAASSEPHTGTPHDGRRTVLLRRLSEHASSGMRDVVETLQPAQIQAMTAAPDRCLIVQGSAGSGKTTIGFHRLSWLCAPERSEHVRARPDHILALMPNDILADYAAKIVPALELDGVHITTPERWMTSFLGIEKMTVTDLTMTLLLGNSDQKAQAWKRAKALGRSSIYALLHEHVRQEVWQRLQRLGHRVVDASSPQPLELSTDTLWTLAEAALLSPGASRRLMGSLEERAAMTGKTVRHGSPVWNELDQIRRALLGNLLPVNETRRLLGSAELLRRAGADEDLIQTLLSQPLAALPKPKGSSVDVTELPAMVCMACIVQGLGEPYDEILLDEAQDFQPLLYHLLNKVVRPGHLTALGDLSQGIAGYKGPASWEEVRLALGGETHTQLQQLPVTYRSTAPISEASARIAATYSKVIHSDHIGREGDDPRYLSSPEALAEHLHALLDAEYRNIAVITRKTITAQNLPAQLLRHNLSFQAITEQHHRYAGGLIAIPVHLSKGLEFDAAIVYDASPQAYAPQTEYDNRLLYVAASRGLHQLAFYAEGEFHPLVAQNTA